MMLIKRISAIALIAVLAFKIIPLVNEATQSDIKNIALDAKKLQGEVSMYGVNKPSFAFYADKISYRDYDETNIIFTRVDKLSFLDIEYEVISQHGNYLLIKKIK